MADVTKTIHVKVVTFNPALGTLVPVPGAKVLCEDSGILWDPNLSDGNATTDAQGLAAVDLTFDDATEKGLNPFFTVTVPSGSRAVPAGEPAERRVELPGEWVTRHYAKRRVKRLADHAQPANALPLFVGMPAHLRVSYTDFDGTGVRNPVALPQDTAKIHLADYDVFIFDFLDFLNPDDVMTGKGFDPVTGKVVDVGADERYRYFDEWPTVPVAADAPAGPAAWFDPPGAPLGVLGGGSFGAPGRVAVDRHGFVFALDGDTVRRFYPDGTLCETIPHPGDPPLTGPKGLALDQYSNLYVADTGADRVRVYTPEWSDGRTGRYDQDSVFGTAGAGNGQFGAPEGLAVITDPQVDGTDRLAVADTGNHRVQVLEIDVAGSPANPFLALRAHRSRTVTLSFALAFGTSGNGAGQFTDPVGVAADRQGRLFVADRALHRVSRWAPDPTGAAYLHQADWEKTGGGAGAGPLEFNGPVDVAADPAAGTVYVADAGNKRVQRLDAETGAHLATWTPAGAGPAGAFTPAGVAVDGRSEVYASDTAAPRIVRATRFDAAGAALGDAAPPVQVGAPWTPRDDPAHMRAPGYLAFAADGRLWVADTGNDRVLSFQRTGGKLVPAPGPKPAPGGLSKPVGIAPDPAGGLFVVDGGNNLVRRFDANLDHQADLGGPGAGPSQFADPRGVALVQRADPTLYVADTGNNRVQVVRTTGAFTGSITTGGGTALAAPEDVAADAAGNLYVADTGNARIVQFDATDAYVRDIVVPVHNLPPGVGAAQPCGVVVDDEGKLLVTDRVQATVYRLDPDGTLLAHWDLTRFLRLQIAAPDRLYDPDLARQLRFAAPARAAIDGLGLLAVADTGNDRVRPVRTATRIDVLLLDLGEGQPDVSFRAITRNDYFAELGLKLNVGDVSIIDALFDQQDFIGKPVSDFSDDEFVLRHVIVRGDTSTNAAINVMKVVREVQSWYKRLTRADDVTHRWGTPATAHTLDVDLTNSDWSTQFLDVNLGEAGHDGRGSDAWDDTVIAHEMTHWVFDKAASPSPPYSIVGLFDLDDDHGSSTIGTFNQALSEGFGDFVALSWGSEGGPTDRVRGYGIAGGDELTTVKGTAKGARFEHLFGGASNVVPPSFDQPGRNLRNEGYISNYLYQLQHLLTDPGVLFADAPSFWYRFNVAAGDADAKRFTDTIWRALRDFPENPEFDDWDNASTVYLRALLRRVQASQPDFAEAAQTLMELNNLIMPVIEVRSGTPAAPGDELGATIDVKAGQARQLVVKVRSATGAPLRGYHLRFTVGSAANYALPGGPGPVARHGRRPAPGAAIPATELHRATNVDGMVGLTYTPPALPPGTASSTEVFRVAYQPDFDADETFAPPGRGDDRDATLRRAYLRELRWASKTWSGAGTNFGAEVAKSVTFRIGKP